MWREKIKNGLLRFSQASPKRFVALMVLMMFVFKIPFVPVMLALGGWGTTEGTAKLGVVGVLFSFLLLPLETLLGQAFPLWVLRKFGVSCWTPLCLLSAAFFGVLHLPAGPGAFFVGLGGGMSLSLCWLVWRGGTSLKASSWLTLSGGRCPTRREEGTFLKALIGTTLVHFIHNFLCFFGYFVQGGAAG